MSTMYKILLFLIFFSSSLFAQNQSMDALKKDYPQLTGKFGKELENQRADYIFAIDVSGTMNNYKDIVVPALQDFFRSLEMGDYVSVIKFGGEAANELSSYGTISPPIIESLVNYVPNLYRKPTNALDKKRYYDYTDLDAMLVYLADDLKMIGRNRLKFVFIITDFIHDPPTEKRGLEQWAVTARRLKNEQSENLIYAFALQLPGNMSGRDLDKVMNVLKPAIADFDVKEIPGSAALSEWFARKKNEIMLDKLTALVKSKNTDAAFNVAPEFNIDGKLDLDVSWKPNELYDCLSVDSLMINNSHFRFVSRLPTTTTNENQIIPAGRIKNRNLFDFPFFRTYRDSLTVQASLVAGYQNELTRLGIEPQVISRPIPVQECIFSFIFPLWLSLLLMFLLIIYLFLVIKALARNRSDKYRLNGTFVVHYDSEEITQRKKSIAQRKIDFGRGATFLPVNHGDCNWKLEMQTITRCPFLLKRPSYRVQLLQGNKFEVGANKFGSHQIPSIGKGSTIKVNDFSVKWILDK